MNSTIINIAKDNVKALKNTELLVFNPPISQIDYEKIRGKEIVPVIYEISNLIDDRVYIGSAVHYTRRWNEHKNDLIRNKHNNPHLQNFYNKYGMDFLRFSIIEECDRDNLLDKENHYFGKYYNKFNISTDARLSMLNRNHSPETLIKMSNSAMGRKLSEESIRKISEGNTGKKRSPEQLERKRLALINSNYVPWNKGKTNVYSEQTLVKMSESNKGKLLGDLNPMRNPIIAKKVSDKLKGRTVPQEMRERIRQTMLNSDKTSTHKKVKTIDALTKEEKVFKSRRAAGRELNLDSSDVSKAIKYGWERKGHHFISID